MFSTNPIVQNALSARNYTMIGGGHDSITSTRNLEAEARLAIALILHEAKPYTPDRVRAAEEKIRKLIEAKKIEGFKRRVVGGGDGFGDSGKWAARLEADSIKELRRRGAAAR